VIAGYPEPGESSRETMMALPGLCLVTGRHEDAKKILRAAVKSLRQGLLPEGEDSDRTSADASLWLFVAAWKYLQATGDEAFCRDTLLPALRKIVKKGDGLLTAGETVEVNALGYNALSILAGFEARLGDPAEAKRLIQRARRVQKSFQEAFWDEERGCLGRDVPPRPGQVLALSLPFPLLPKPKAARLLAALEPELSTPGPWLGSYLTALVRVHGAAGRKRGLAALETLKPRLAGMGVGSARAWSVAELLRAYVEDLQGGEAKAVKEKASSPARNRRAKNSDS